MNEQSVDENIPLGFGASQNPNENKILGERLQFERLVSGLSSRFVKVAPERLSAEIECALKIILDFFKVDRCGLLQILRSKGVWVITHFALSDRIPPVPKGVQLPVSISPWTYEKLVEKREPVIISKIDDVPPEAEIDKKTWIEWGIRSNLVIPILTHELVTHVIAINSVKSERTWPEGFIPRLQLLGKIFVNSIERQRMQLQLEQRLKFEEMLSVLSAKFVNLPSDQVDVEIENGLQHIARFLGLDRCVMALLSDDKSQTITSHSWVANGVESVTAVIGNEMIPWVASRIMRSEPAVIPSIDELPEDAVKDKALFNHVGIKSALYVPLTVGGEIHGILGFASLHAERAWPEEVVRGLQLAADVFSNALVRQKKDRALRAAQMEYRTILNFTFDWEYWENLDGSIRYSSPSCERITGYPPQAFVDDPLKLRSLISSEDRDAWDEHFRAARLAPGPHEIQYRIKRPDGDVRWIEHVCNPITDDQGILVGIRASNRDVTQRVNAQAVICEREKELQSLTGRLILGQEEERRRLARELHDDLSQRLAALAIEIGKLETRVEDGKEAILQDLCGLRDQTIRVAADVHYLSRRLHPSILEDLGLTKAVAAECNRFSIQEGIEVAFNADNIPEGLPKDVSLSVYRIIQEGLNNIAKHACARRAVVCLSASEASLHLSIQDDGLGFDPAEVRKMPGLGLSSIRERVRLVNGRHRIKSEPEKGTMIEVTVPLQPAVPKAECAGSSEELA